MLDERTICGIKPADLPTPPQAALQIMRACSQENTNNEELSKIASSDPVITAEILRIVNSALFGFSGNIQSIAKAISILGLKALRNLALCIAVRDTLKEDAIPGFDTKLFWEDDLRRAVCARQLAKTAKIDADECFTAGLLQDFGLLVMFYLQPDKASFWPELRVQDPDARYASESKTFGVTHEQITIMLANSWSLPDDLASALGFHHTVPNGDPKNPNLSTVLYCADWVSSIYSADDKSFVLATSKQLLAKSLDMTPENIDSLLEQIPAQVEEAATALGLRIDEQIDFDAVLREANIQLAYDNQSYQELTWRLQKTLKERDRLSAELKKEMRLAREIQISMLPKPPGKNFPILAVNVSARQLSGDFYDFFTLDDGRIYFNLGDVAGKGTNAALLMAKTSSLFRCLGKKILDPGVLLQQINNELFETSIRGMFVSMACGIYDPKSGDIILANAGHPPMLLLSKKEKPKAIEAQAPPLGIVADCKFPEKKHNLGADCLYLYSDGLIEARCGDGKPLGLRGLLGILEKQADKPPQKRVNAILSRFKNSPVPLRDDVTLLLVERQNG